jgi:hypothetical protein
MPQVQPLVLAVVAFGQGEGEVPRPWRAVPAVTVMMSRRMVAVRALASAGPVSVPGGAQQVAGHDR